MINKTCFCTDISHFRNTYLLQAKREPGVFCFRKKYGKIKKPKKKGNKKSDKDTNAELTTGLYIHFRYPPLTRTLGEQDRLVVPIPVISRIAREKKKKNNQHLKTSGNMVKTVHCCPLT